MTLAIAALSYFMLTTCIADNDHLELDEMSFLQVRSIFNKIGPDVHTDQSLESSSGGQSSEDSFVPEPGHDDQLLKDVRPHFDAQVPDVVQFGVLLKNWHSIELADQTCDLDVVITLRWPDPRTKQLIPEGQEHLRMSTEDAHRLMWLPDIAVTNAEEGENNIISSSVGIGATGDVEQVQRLYVRVKEAFTTKEFPFDTQDLSVILGSLTHMSGQLVLEPIDDSSLWGAAPEQFDSSIWYLLNSSQTIYEDIDGSLRKSRGRFSMTVKRGHGQFRSSIFIPSIIFLVMTWSALWLPLGGPYNMPRVSINATALLCQVFISQKADNMIPATGESSWMTMYLELCVELQFLVMLINMILTRIDNKTSEAHGLAGQLNSELSLTFPITTSINIFILWKGYYSLSRPLLGLVYLIYLSYLGLRFYFREEVPSKPAQDAQ